MTKEEVLQLVQKGELTEKEMLEFYEVKNRQGLETLFEMKFDKLDFNNEFLVNSFKFMFETREGDQFNPLEEKYRHYAMILPGLFGIPSEHVQILVAGLGLFAAMMMLDKLLKEKEEVQYFNGLYEEYKKEMYSIGRTANKYVKLLDSTLSGFLENNGKGALEKIIKEFIQAKSELLDKID